MENWYLNSQDLFTWLSIPVIILTVKEMSENWQSLFDDQLTGKDRRLLLRFALFILMPVVVLFHELGHAAAILYYGGKIAEFHYGILWGYVVPAGLFTKQQLLVIYLAGNVVEVICGLVSLAVAVFSKSPPIVATAVYLALASIAGTLVLYTLMSVLGMYGDWQAIYTSPVTDWVIVIGACHAVCLLLIVYCVYGNRTRVWFARRTNPVWANRFDRLSEKAQADPSSPERLLDLAWAAYEGGIDRLARQTVNKCKLLAPEKSDPWFLEGWIDLRENRLKEAQKCFHEVTGSPTASQLMKARAHMAVAQTLLYKLETGLRGGTGSEKQYTPILDAYKAAAGADPELADPLFFRARLFNKVGLHNQALEELQATADLKWLNPDLADLVPDEAGLAREKAGAHQ